MNKQITVAVQIEELRNAVENQDGNVEELFTALTKRRLRAEQKAEIVEIMEEWGGEEGEENNSMSNQLRKYRSAYITCVAASGSKSLNNGDKLANFLEYKDAKEVMKLADEFTPITGMKHATKCENLNIGSKRMNAGNKLRAALKRGDIEFVHSGNKVTGLKHTAK